LLPAVKSVDTGLGTLNLGTINVGDNYISEDKTRRLRRRMSFKTTWYSFMYLLQLIKNR